MRKILPYFLCISSMVRCNLDGGGNCINHNVHDCQYGNAFFILPLFAKASAVEAIHQSNYAMNNGCIM